MPASLRKLCFFSVLWIALGGALLAQTARDRAVELTAAVQDSPPTITLQWTATSFTLTGQKVFRRLKNASTWTQVATPANTDTSYADTNVSAGVSYEYYVARTFSDGPGTASGYVASGIRVPVVADRGRVILLVDDTMATPLSTELARLAGDLAGDGWTVVRQDVSRNATPPSIRTAIRSIYNTNPTKTVALILFGHVPVPYSGDFAMDGHPDHFGAWPTDLYYGEMNGTWTDTTVNDTQASDPRNQNVPGDGKFDHTTIPSNIELEVGRIDLASMPSFGIGETELLRRYLDRDHAYRYKLGAYASVPRRGLINDNFGYFGGEAFAATAWRSLTACVGSANVQELGWFSTLPTQSYLWAYGCGGGTYQGAGGVGGTSDFANNDSLAVFTMLFGSYFGDWDNSDAFLRAPLGGTASSLGLICVWAGRPYWMFHPMALGETTGYCARLTQNNPADTQHGYDSNNGAHCNHIALMGDPTLRLYPVAPATNLTTSVASNAVTLNWSASADGPIEGYLVERASSATGPFVQLGTALVAGTTYVDGTITNNVSYTYRVRAVKIETSPTGTYYNSSQGAFASVSFPAAIAINPASVNRSIHAGDSVTETLNISDPASGALVYTISSSLARYSFRDSDSFAGPAYGWMDISGSGTEITGWDNSDDAISAPIGLGFNFPFYGNAYNTVRVCTNGYLSFTDTNTNADNGSLPNASAAANMVAALWTDLILGSNSHIYWQAMSGKLVVQFEHMALFKDANADLTFQIILQPSGEIFFQYKTLTALTGYTIGIQNSTRDDGLVVAQGEPYVHTGMAIRVRPPGLESWLSLTASSGTVPAGGAQQIGAMLNASGLAPGDYYAELTVASNAVGQESVTIPVRFTVGNTPVENWRLAHFGSTADTGAAADAANGDGDAANNLLEYAFGRDPSIPDSSTLVASNLSAGGYLQVQFQRDATQTDLRYTVEAASSLTGSWTPIATSTHGAPVVATGAHSVNESGNGIYTVIVEDSAPAATFTSRFLRVRILRD